jgi:drug/metabolite transporter (DMT)-like permease
MSWLIITLGAYFFNAIAMVIDKTILKQEVKNPFVYTFYIAALAVILIILASPLLLILPISIDWPGISQFIVSLAAGGTASIGLFLMFFALKREEASRLTPMIGGLSPIIVFILAYFFLGEILSQRQIFAFVLIVAGSFIISLEFDRQRGILSWLKQKISGRILYDLPQVRKTLWLALPAAIFFGISYTLTKDVYNHQNFFSGFVWTRVGSLLIVLLPMLWAANRHDLLHPKRNQGVDKAKSRFLFGQACGGVSVILIQYAISLASVSLIQALQGTQYAFVFLIVLITTFYFPKFLREEMSRQIIIQKTIAIFLIGSGIYFII